MRKAVLIPLALGIIFLIIGIAQSYSSLTYGVSILCTGTVRNPYNNETSHEETQPKQTIPTTQLNIIGLLIILASLGFFTVAYFNNRNFFNKQKSTETF